MVGRGIVSGFGEPGAPVIMEEVLGRERGTGVATVIQGEGDSGRECLEMVRVKEKEKALERGQRSKRGMTKLTDRETIVRRGKVGKRRPRVDFGGFSISGS